MNNCERCGQPNKVLFNSWYCDCVPPPKITYPAMIDNSGMPLDQVYDEIEKKLKEIEDMDS